MKNYTIIGIVAGLLLAFFWWLGFGYVVLAILLGAIGGLIGAHYDGRIDLGAIWNNLIGKEKGRG